MHTKAVANHVFLIDQEKQVHIPTYSLIEEATSTALLLRCCSASADAGACLLAHARCLSIVWGGACLLSCSMAAGASSGQGGVDFDGHVTHAEHCGGGVIVNVNFLMHSLMIIECKIGIT